MPLPPSSPAMTDHPTDIGATIYTATTPAELRAAVLDLCCAALLEWDSQYSGGRHHLHVAESVVPPVPPTWRIVTVSGQSYRCADNVLECLHGDDVWSKATWVHPSHILMFADLIANPTESAA